MKNLKVAIHFFVIAVSGVAISVSHTSCDFGKEDEQARIDSLRNDSIQRSREDSIISAFQNTMQEIDDNLAEIREKQGLIVLGPESTDVEEHASKDRIIQNIAAINELMESNREQLDQLYGKLQKFEVRNDKLESMMKSIEQRLSQKEGEITDLKSQLMARDFSIEELNVKLDSIRSKNEGLRTSIVELDDELNTVFYTVGSKKDLKDRGIVTKTGGILGLGSVKKLDQNAVKEGDFNAVDKRETTEILLYANDAKLVTSHPDGSFEWKTKEDKTVQSLMITDPGAFWASTRYLVIEVD